MMYRVVEFSNPLPRGKYVAGYEVHGLRERKRVVYFPEGKPIEQKELVPFIRCTVKHDR